MALDELKLYSVPSAGEVLLYPVFVPPVVLGELFLYSSETSNVVTLHDLAAAESAGGGSPQTFSVGVATESDSANDVTLVPGAVSFDVGVAAESATSNEVTLLAGGVTVSIGVATETDAANAVSLSNDTASPDAEVRPYVRFAEYTGLHEFMPNHEHTGAWEFGPPNKRILVR